MIDTVHNRNAAGIAELVRRNAGSAGFAAALMIYFGFFAGYTRPAGTDWFSIGNLVLFYTMRIGGVAMAGIAIGSMVGVPFVLAVDAIVSISIGVLLGLSAVVMLLDGGSVFFNLMYVVFGIMFVSAGVRNGTTFLSITRLTSCCAPPDTMSAAAPPPATPNLQFTQPDGSTMAGRLRQRLDKTDVEEDSISDSPLESSGGFDIDEHEAEDSDEWSVTVDAPDESPLDVSESAERDHDEPSPEDSGGYLASFSNPQPPPE